MEEEQIELKCRSCGKSIKNIFITSIPKDEISRKLYDLSLNYCLDCRIKMGERLTKMLELS